MKQLYDHPRYVLEELIHSIVDAAPVRNGSEKEIRRLYDTATQHCRALKAAKADSFKTLLTVILQQKLDEKTWLKWAEFNSDNDNVPLCMELRPPCEAARECVLYQAQTNLRIGSRGVGKAILCYIHR